MAELDTITIKGFKSIASVENLELGAINLVIGANGSGKSNFIGVFSFLHAIREGRLQEYVIQAGGADKVLHFGSKVTSAIHLHVWFQGATRRYEIDLAEEPRMRPASRFGATSQYEIDLSPTGGDELVPSSELIYFTRRNAGLLGLIPQQLTRVGKEAGISTISRAMSYAGYVRRRLGTWRLYHFHDTSSSSPMKKTADVNDNRYLRPDASNLAAILYYLRIKHEPAYNLIRRTVQRVAPFFDDFQLEPQRLNPNKIRLEWRHKGSEAYFDASSLSDGTLRFIALTTLFLQPEEYRPSVILVDEPELGLHPYAITMLASLVKQAAASAKTQVILSTQSPLLLDHFQPEDVLVADRVDGATQFTRLDAAKLATWLEDYSLGQLWEKNELGGRPGGE